jgi:spore coat protein U-like protein
MKRTFAKIALISALSAVALAAAPASYATSKTATFQVSLTVQDDCSVSANPLDFGSTGVLENNLDQNSTLSVTCTKGTPYTVALDAGSATGSTTDSRLLTSAAGSDAVKYNLYRDAARTQVWGQTAGNDTASDTGTGNAKTMTVYGRVPPQAVPAPDTYTSTVTATVVF